MKKIIIIFSFIIILYNQAFANIEVKTSLGISGEWKVNKWAPLFINIKNLGSKVSLKVDILFTQGLRFSGNSKTLYTYDFEIPALSTRSLEVLLPPLDFRYPLEINITSQERNIDYKQKLEYNLERAVLPIILIIGERQNLRFFLPSKTRVINIVNEKDLPTNYKAYDGIDLILVDYNFWRQISTNRKNALRLCRIFNNNVYFFEEVNNIFQNFKFSPAKIQFFPPTFLESQDLSILDMQKFLYPNRVEILFILFFYFITLYFIRRFLKLRFQNIIILVIIILACFIAMYKGDLFRKDALIVGEKNLVYLTPQKEIAEIYSHIVVFSPFKRELNFNVSDNVIQIYQPFYQPQRGIGILNIDQNKEEGRLYIEKNKISFIEYLSLLLFPLKITYNIKNENIELSLENDSSFLIRNLHLNIEDKSYYLGELKNGERKNWKVSLRNLTKEEDIFSPTFSQWKVKSDIINNEKIVLWGKIENSLLAINIRGVKYSIKYDNLLIVPLKN
ncbi:MAG: hypothetical protein CBR30_00230 [Dictyoglomus sp. NZ13-RE01]|nr:MAG: hypothetical protein CBR30_00230 [Dictyoglomus sp. NZ13-RE01]